MLSKTTNRALQLSGFAALAFATACSDGGDSNTMMLQPTSDASTPIVADGGATGAATDSGACQTLLGLPPGALCTLATGQQGYRSCTNNVPVGDCMPFTLPEGGLSGLLADSGLSGIFADGGLGGLLADGGLSGILGDSSIGITDGGFTLGDATISLEAGSIQCPTGLMCSSIGGALGLPISACSPPGMDIPPAGDCTMGSGPCKLNGASGTCQSFLIVNACLIPCK